MNKRFEIKLSKNDGKSMLCTRLIAEVANGAKLLLVFFEIVHQFLIKTFCNSSIGDRFRPKKKTRENKIEYRILGQDWLLANSVFDISLVLEQAISWLT